MVTETQAPPRPRRVKREPLTVLLTVAMDRERSTPWDELWRAHSDRIADLVYEVRHAVEDGTWRCPCPGFTSHGHCKHCDRCQRLRRVQWWMAFLLGRHPADLRAEHDRLAARDAELGLTEDERCCEDAIDLLTERGKVAA